MSKTDSARTDSPRTEAGPTAKTDPTGAPRGASAGFPFPMPWDLAWTPDGFARLVQEQVTRAQAQTQALTQAVMDELAAHEGVAVQRARTAVDDLARLTIDSIDYAARISAEWRKLALDAGRRTLEAMSPARS